MLSSGSGGATSVFGKDTEGNPASNMIKADTKLSEIPEHVIRFALTKNPFYNFSNLIRFFPALQSHSDFIVNADYLGGLQITLSGDKQQLKEISNLDFLLAIIGLLDNIEREIKSNLTEYEGSEFFNKKISDVFKDKQIKVIKESERSKGQEEVVSDKPWYVFNANYGTAEEKAFVELFSREFDNLKKKFDNVFLIRNEREVKIVDKLGRTFEPDFILYCHKKERKHLTYQVFIEPKGIYLMGNDAWKEDFLIELRKKKDIIQIRTDKYLITGIPFYSNKTENDFKREFENTFT